MKNAVIRILSTTPPQLGIQCELKDKQEGRKMYVITEGSYPL